MPSRALEIVEDLILLPAVEREAALDASCAGDPAVRAEVERLLRAHDSAGAFLGSATRADGAGPSGIGEGPGAVIGRYKLLQQIGEGGFGVVFMAEQREPVRRKVALKIIKLGMDTKQVIARFEAERQALAMMDHPNIARVLDAGATETGRPYFVMELVRGDPITEYCDRQNLSIPERLDLFRQVCAAVQHAHQKGVIHRDIKPGNILITIADGRPVPKVIDFGIAKAISGRLTEKTLFTEFRQLIGTPEYMSPEQAESAGVDIDTRSDIYSLGVLLYELLTGTTPFDARTLRSAGFAEIQRIIREVEPPRPSTRLSTLAKGGGADLREVAQGEEETKRRRDGETKQQRREPSTSSLKLPASGLQRPASSLQSPVSPLHTIARHRRTDPRKLGLVLRGDLDWIVMKCLEKDRARRYDTANALSMDVNRYLTHQPVEAGPPSRLYRTRKFIRRNRRAVAAGALVAAALMLGMIGTSAGMVWALREAERAEEQSRLAHVAAAEAQQKAEELDKVAAFQAAQLSGIEPEVVGLRLRLDLLARAREAAERRGGDAERVGAELESLLTGVNFTDVARETLDVSIFDRTLTAIEAEFADQPLVKARLLQTLANVLRDLGMMERAESPQREALEIRRNLLGDADRDTISSLGNAGTLLGRRHKFVEAESYLFEAFESAKGGLRDEDRSTIEAMNRLGIVLHARGKYAEAERFYRDALDASERVFGNEDPLTLTLIGNLGYLLESAGQPGKAEELYAEAIERRRSVLGPTHPSTLWALVQMGAFLRSQGRMENAEPLLREGLDGYRRSRGDERPQTLHAMLQFSHLRFAQGEFEEAERYAADALRTARIIWPDEFSLTWYLLAHGRALAAQSRFAESEAEMLEAEAIFRASGMAGESPPMAENLAVSLAKALTSLYDAWHAAEPDSGLDVKGGQWRDRLREAEAARAEGVAGSESGDAAGPGTAGGSDPPAGFGRPGG